MSSWHTTVGRYPAGNNYFTTEYVNGHPTELKDNASGDRNGVYLCGSGGFPTNTYESCKYRVDIVLNPSSAGGPRRPGA